MKDINPPAIVRQDSAEVDQLAFEVNSAIEQGDMHTKKGIERYIEAGEGLLRMQAKVPFGQWLITLKQRVKCSQTNCYRYMKAAREKAKITGPVNLEQFLKFLSEKPPEPDSIESGSVSTPFVDQASDVANPQPSSPQTPATQLSTQETNAPPATPTPVAPQAAEILCTACQRKKRVGHELPKGCKDCKAARGEQPAGTGAGTATPAGPATPPASGGGTNPPPEKVTCPACRGKGEVSVNKAASLKFIPPTLEEVAAYCKERKNKVNPEAFIAHYTSNGWKVGKAPMRNWKGCIVTWELNDLGRKGKTPDHEGLKSFAARAARDGTLDKEHGT